MNSEELYDVLVKGFEEKQEQRRIEEEAKPEVALRGGNSGALLEDGRFIGGDPRIAVLRFLGIESKVSFDTNLLFQAGLSNEENVCDLLEASGTFFEQEEECPVSWRTSNGVLVTGRPDIIIERETIIELKGLFSGWSALKQAHWGYGQIKSEYACQLSHYMFKSSYPITNGILKYVSRGHLGFFVGKDRLADPNHRALKIGNNGKIFGSKPFTSLYDFTFDTDSTIMVDGVRTVIDEAAIERFYEYCADCILNRRVPKVKRVSNIYGHDETLDDYNKYYQYPTDIEDFDEWITVCQQIADEGED